MGLGGRATKAGSSDNRGIGAGAGANDMYTPLILSGAKGCIISGPAITLHLCRGTSPAVIDRRTLPSQMAAAAGTAPPIMITAPSVFHANSRGFAYILNYAETANVSNRMIISF